MNIEAARQHILGILRAGLPQDLHYHSADHAVRVECAVDALAQAEGIDGEDLVLLKTGALCHDTGFLTSYRDNEPLACAFTRQHLPAFDYSARQLDVICGLILATAIPQRPTTPLEQLICDADLDHLGAADYPEITARLREELLAHGKRFSDQEWIDHQLNFLKHHTYFTTAALRLREPGKRARIAELERARSGFPEDTP